MKKIISTVLLIILSMNITACFGQSTPTKPQKPPEINSQGEYPLTVRLGEPVQETYQRNPNMFETNDAGIGGMGMMRPVLPAKETLKIRLEILDRDYKPVLNMTNNKDMMFISESEYPEIGTSKLVLRLPLVNDKCSFKEDITDAEYEAHCTEEQKSRNSYNQYAEIISMLKKYGWKPYIHQQYPRILAEDSWDDKIILRDGNGYYIDTYEKWQNHTDKESGDIFVLFFNKDLILQLSISDIYSYIEINTNQYDYYFRYNEKTRSEKWREYLAADVQKWAEERAQAEAELREKGYTINEEYEDAPLPDYQTTKETN